MSVEASGERNFGKLSQQNIDGWSDGGNKLLGKGAKKSPDANFSYDKDSAVEFDSSSSYVTATISSRKDGWRRERDNYSRGHSRTHYSSTTDNCSRVRGSYFGRAAEEGPVMRHDTRVTTGGERLSMSGNASSRLVERDSLDAPCRDKSVRQITRHNRNFASFELYSEQRLRERQVAPHAARYAPYWRRALPPPRWYICHRCMQGETDMKTLPCRGKGILGPCPCQAASPISNQTKEVKSEMRNKGSHYRDYNEEKNELHSSSSVKFGNPDTYDRAYVSENQKVHCRRKQREDFFSSNVINNRNKRPWTLPVSPERSLIRSTSRKLLVLDVNGLLADVTQDFHNTDKAHKLIGRKAVFKRPFCDDFLKSCFENFEVGIWSSRKRRNLNDLVDYLIGDARQKLLFCWDQSKCTYTGFNTIENDEKPLVLKEMKKLWNKEEPGLPWNKGVYSPSNTLLVDDSPYKALCNPPHTAIFPNPYHFYDEDDCSLGPGGDLRVYIEQLALADDVQKYVETHPFGQGAITAENPSWNFYQRIIRKFG